MTAVIVCVLMLFSECLPKKRNGSIALEIVGLFSLTDVRNCIVESIRSKTNRAQLSRISFKRDHNHQ